MAFLNKSRRLPLRRIASARIAAAWILSGIVVAVAIVKFGQVNHIREVHLGNGVVVEMLMKSDDRKINDQSFE